MRLTNAQCQEIKEQILTWLQEINETETLPKGIKVLHFNLFEPFAIELSGSKVYSTDNDEWTFRSDFLPEENRLEDFDEIVDSIESHYLLNVMIRILKEIIQENQDFQIFKVPFITTGFSDREVVLIK